MTLAVDPRLLERPFYKLWEATFADDMGRCPYCGHVAIRHQAQYSPLCITVPDWVDDQIIEREVHVKDFVCTKCAHEFTEGIIVNGIEQRCPECRTVVLWNAEPEVVECLQCADEKDTASPSVVCFMRTIGIGEYVGFRRLVKILLANGMGYMMKGKRWSRE